MALEDLLNSSLTESQVRIQVNTIYDFLKSQTIEAPRMTTRIKTPGTVKSLKEFYELVRQAIVNYETRAGTLDINKVNFTEEEPDFENETPTITFSLMKREPGSFSQGAPGEGDVKNLRPRLRESLDDPTFPGYKKMITGMWYDNIVRFTCWARTNKVANQRAEWFENLMDDYTWWFVISGIQRVIYKGQSNDIVVTVKDNKWYGRPIDYFVRTEKLKTTSEKTLEEIIITLVTKRDFLEE